MGIRLTQLSRVLVVLTGLWLAACSGSDSSESSRTDTVSEPGGFQQAAQFASVNSPTIGSAVPPDPDSNRPALVDGGNLWSTTEFEGADFGEGREYIELVSVPNDPLAPDFDITNVDHITAAMQGAWILEDCAEHPAPYGSITHIRPVVMVRGFELILDSYAYETDDCSDSPTGEWYPLEIRAWRLGEAVALANGEFIWTFDSILTQRGNYQGVVGDQVDSRYFNIAGFRDGNLVFGGNDSLDETGRPLELSDDQFVRRPSQTATIEDASVIAGIWDSGCTGTLRSTLEFHPDRFVLTDENWTTEGCAGESFAIRRSTFSIEYGAQRTSLFGDPMIPVAVTAQANEMVRFDESQGFPRPEFKVVLGDTEYRAFALENNHNLILGYCLYRSSGVDDCQDSEDRSPDIVDFNWRVRYAR